ncbi:T1N6.14 protein [Fagus crenata]
MAEAKAFEEEGSNSKTHLTPPMSQPRPQGQPSKPTPPLPPNTNKRKLIDIIPTNPNSSYFKIRALTRQLRPHFIEVLRTPDFQNCKAADEVRKREFFIIHVCLFGLTCLRPQSPDAS